MGGGGGAGSGRRFGRGRRGRGHDCIRLKTRVKRVAIWDWDCPGSVNTDDAFARGVRLCLRHVHRIPLNSAVGWSSWSAPVATRKTWRGSSSHREAIRPARAASAEAGAEGRNPSAPGSCRPTGPSPSMGSVGDAYDNAMAESFFSTLECELLARRRFASRAEARMACSSFIEGWYNPARLHSALGYRSPSLTNGSTHQRSWRNRNYPSPQPVHESGAIPAVPGGLPGKEHGCRVAPAGAEGSQT